jgi:glycosyltransferase involved in cell wall biosynthesis
MLIEWFGMKNRKNILIVSAVFPPEPVVSANLSFDIANELVLNNNVTVISPLPTRPFGANYENILPKTLLFRHEILKTYTCPKSNFIGRLRESYSLGKATSKYLSTEETKIDVIYANTWPVFAQMILAKTARRLKIPVVFHIQDVYPESFIMKLPSFLGKIVQFLIMPIDKFVLNNAQKVITISPQMKNYLVITRNLKEANVFVVRNWQNDEFFTNYKLQENIKSDMFTFMYLGSVSTSAGVELLINSFANANIKNSKLIIAGDGSEKTNCINLAKKYTCEIEFCDAPFEIVPELQAKADVLLLPLRKGIGKTASPSKLPAYMLSKKPIIACVDEDSDIAMVINTAGCGWILPPEDISVLSEMMKYIVVFSKEELKKMGESGFNYAIKNLSKRKNLNELVALIEGL